MASDAKHPRTRVLRPDGKLINVVQKRGHLSVCVQGCCCGLVERGHAAVPVDLYKREWRRRKLRNSVHLTLGGCLGPCALSNVVLLLFDGRPIWFHTVNSEVQVLAIYDYIDQMLAADGYLPPPAALAGYVFNSYSWKHPPGGAPGAAPALPVGEPAAPGILFLSHADTDVLALEDALAALPEGFPPVHAASLGSLATEEHTVALMEARGASAGVIVVRLLGDPGQVPGFGRVVDGARRRGQQLIVVSGTGTPDPELTALSTVRPAVAHQTIAYLEAGGRANLAQLLRFLADHLLFGGFGYEAPLAHPPHGIYHPDLPAGAGGREWQQRRDPSRPTVGILFYRAHLLGGNLGFVDAMVREVESRGANALPVFTTSLKEPGAPRPDARQWPAAFDLLLDAEGRPVVDVLITTLAFAMGEVSADGPTPSGWSVDALAELDVPVLQAITAGVTRWQWELAARGLNPLDTAMHVALPEFDGRIVTVPISFKERRAAPHEGAAPSGAFDALQYVPEPERVARVVGLALRMAALRRTPNAEKRVAFVLTNSAGKAARIGNAVGLDAPASLVGLLAALRDAGYRVEGVPPDGDALIHALIDRCSYDETLLTAEQLGRAAGRVPVGRYAEWFDELTATQREKMRAQWGPAPGEAYVHDGAIALAGLEMGNVFVALQPPRGYGMDPDAIYHRPDLPPPHNYHALYRWLRDVWRADAVVHVGKHGTVEWLPGKGVGLSADCFPDALVADLPVFYPFILNDPGEGMQAKRRTHAVVVDHLTPPMTTADAYGEVAELAQLVDEYYQVEQLDPSKLPILQQQIWALIQRARIDSDMQAILQGKDKHAHKWDPALSPEGTPVMLTKMRGADVAHFIQELDGYLCELTGAQIRDGLHVLGQVPAGEQMVGLLEALTRVANLDVPSLRGGVAALFGLDLDALLAERGARLEAPPPALVRLADRPLATRADALETVDELARHLLAVLADGGFAPTSVSAALDATFGPGAASSAGANSLARTLEFVCRRLVPDLRRSTDEIDALVRGLAGRYVPAGPSGAPTRGMAHVLPTGRNFYAVDPRAIPSLAAWEVGRELAREAVERYRTEAGTYPESVGISVWGTSAMRTQGDDVAQILALLGVRPVRQPENRRVLGIEVIPLAALGRPRIDVTVRISGFFRDAFPHLIKLIDEAVAAVAALDEPSEQNFVRKHCLEDVASAVQGGAPREDAERQGRYRVFGSPPGTYGAGILPLIDERNWRDDADLAEVYVNWGGYAYTADAQGVDARAAFRRRLAGVQVAVHNQDNREHDIFDSDDYLQFHGGMIATIRALTGRQPRHYFGDTHDPARPVVRDLREEALRVFRTRVVNPKWLESITRHGYKGGLELAATVDYLFGYDATADVVEDWMYERVTEAYALDPAMQAFFARSNPWALRALSERLLEAAERGLWAEPSAETLDALRQSFRHAEDLLEERAEARVASP